MLTMIALIVISLLIMCGVALALTTCFAIWKVGELQKELEN